MSNFREFIISTILISIFLLAMITFAIQTATLNNPNNSIINDPLIKDLNVSLTGNLSVIQTDAENQKTSFEKETPIVGDSNLIFTSLFGALKKFRSLFSNIFNLISSALYRQLGIPPLVLGGISAIIIITFILLMWKVVKSGE